jgi:hypothetical protein
MDGKALSQDVLPAVVKLAADTVPNVRFNAARVLGAIATRVDARSGRAVFAGREGGALELGMVTSAHPRHGCCC